MVAATSTSSRDQRLGSEVVVHAQTLREVSSLSFLSYRDSGRHGVWFAVYFCPGIPRRSSTLTADTLHVCQTAQRHLPPRVFGFCAWILSKNRQICVLVPSRTASKAVRTAFSTSQLILMDHAHFLGRCRNTLPCFSVGRWRPLRAFLSFLVGRHRRRGGRSVMGTI